MVKYHLSCNRYCTVPVATVGFNQLTKPTKYHTVSVIIIGKYAMSVKHFILLKIYKTAEKHYAQDRKCLLKLSNT